MRWCCPRAADSLLSAWSRIRLVVQYSVVRCHCTTFVTRSTASTPSLVCVQTHRDHGRTEPGRTRRLPLRTVIGVLDPLAGVAERMPVKRGNGISPHSHSLTLSSSAGHVQEALQYRTDYGPVVEGHLVFTVAVSTGSQFRAVP